MNATVIYLVGPTGVGKSAVAMAAALAVGAEIVNADAFQLYRGLEVLSAAPPPDDRARVRHHLYGVLDPSEPCDAARFAAMARPCLADLAARGVPALVVGGSGLYLKALTHGLADLPTDAKLRLELSQRPLSEKVAELRQRDPAGAATLNLGNPRYVDRALEICRLTGRPASEVRATWAVADPAGLAGVWLTRERADLHDRINRRVEAMVAAGALTEVQALRACGEAALPTASKAIGFREIREFLDGRCSLADAVAAIQQATRRYAKRQMTWFRREAWLKTVCLGAGETPDSAAADVIRLFSHDRSPCRAE